ncbi:hypothetical protein C8R45DRAFT_875860 [Mycena sanguinolenta]|nr:hypothetical protein C8R45DRAFT_875860 [Mycena sanguinolenta]
MSRYAHNRPSTYAPASRQCFGLTASGRCTSPLSAQGFCTSHQPQAMWLGATHISAAERRIHAEGRRCCGLTKKNALCRNNPGGNFMFCYLHGGQRPVEGLGPAAGPEPPQTAVVRERMREFFRIQRESAAREDDARARWAREEQGRRERAREEAEREQRRREQAREEAERERRRQQESQWRQQQQEQQERAKRERQRQEESERAREREEQNFEVHAKILQSHLDASAAFDATTFSRTNPNSFARVPWPVFPHRDGTVSLADITAENIRRFFDKQTIQRFKTERQLDIILKNTARRFHPDRFCANRDVVASIRDAGERNTVIQAAEVVIKTVNACRGT